ncbi:DUF5642 family protein [Mycolicibacterium goodii]|uniref:DUF5642 family protein n=1 Tax=Mycolicibacterium goodii TaxID=134601 RepID=UPI001BDC4B1C|nr:DUF5642 family protein [Mycolicibacterium goodii]MBU8809139.1 DUF5642 family protein [Mycolicibacterium goodii]
MRICAAAIAMCLAAAPVIAACGEQAPPSVVSATVTSSAGGPVNPARIDRVRYDLPPGYEVSGFDGRVDPLSQWGFGAGWGAEPPVCGEFAVGAVDPASARGWTGSGSGGIVYAVIATSAATTSAPGPEVADCGEWTVTGGHSTATVTRLDAPVIEGARTTGMAATIVTVVEGGTETQSHADTFAAELDGYRCTVTVITDPGSPNAALDTGFAAALLVKTVSALRG